MSEHTPTPWRRDQYGYVIDAKGKSVSANGFSAVMSHGDSQDVARANAAFIVRAVNAYDDLVAALRPFAELADIFASTGASKIGGPDMGKALDAARAALTKAQQP